MSPSRVAAVVLDLLYPPRCPLCGLFAEDAPCGACLGEFKPLPNDYRTETSGPLAYRASLYAYEGRAAQAVRRLKYARSTAMARGLSQLMHEGLVQSGLEPDLIIPVPIHWSRRFVRGFNQAELLCLDLPVADARSLRRVRATRPQVGLSHTERQSNLDGAFRAEATVEGKHVLLIDDVLTTGSTARACAGALREFGAAEVGALALTGE